MDDVMVLLLNWEQRRKSGQEALNIWRTGSQPSRAASQKEAQGSTTLLHTHTHTFTDAEIHTHIHRYRDTHTHIHRSRHTQVQIHTHTPQLSDRAGPAETLRAASPVVGVVSSHTLR